MKGRTNEWFVGIIFWGTHYHINNGAVKMSRIGISNVKGKLKQFFWEMTHGRGRIKVQIKCLKLRGGGTNQIEKLLV